MNLNNKNYEIIINADTKNYLFKKYFSKHISKNYNSTAFTTIITHSKLSNKIAEHILQFLDLGFFANFRSSNIGCIFYT